MPPPTASDSWLASRRFGIVIDAGSSGSRLQIYSWKDARKIRLSASHDDALLEALPRVEKGTQTGDDWLRKVEPGISGLGMDPGVVGTYLRPLLSHALQIVPPSLHADTPIFLLATAGMRLLPVAQQTAIIDSACSFFRFHSDFRLDPPSSHGPCGSSIRIITGEEEGLFGWIAVNYLMDGFAGHEENHRATFGFLDMGGASTQIAFEPSVSERAKMSSSTADNLVEVRLRLLGGEEIHHQVFVTTWLGYGTNQARERYVSLETENWESNPDHVNGNAIPDPCLPQNLAVTEVSVMSPSAANPHSRNSHSFIGTGSFPQCLERTAPLLNKEKPCPDVSCLFNGVPAPKIDFALSKFIGVSEYWYSSEHVFGLGGAYDFVQFERAATEFCSRDWDDIVQEHNATRADSATPAGKGGNAAVAGKWGPEVGVGRLRMQCFKAAWIVNMLHEGIGMPRIVDPGGNSTSHEVDKAADVAEDKGLGRLVGPPTFQSVDTIGDTAISWTLGKMVLEASKEVPPISSSTPPLTDPDPHHRLPNDHFSEMNSSFRHRLSSRGFVFIYVVLLGLCTYLILRFRRRISSTPRSRRRRDPEDNPTLLDYFSMDESGGNISSPSSSPPNSPTAQGPKSKSRFVRSLRHMLRSLSRPLRVRRTRPSRKSTSYTSSSDGYVRPGLRQTRSSPSTVQGSRPSSPFQSKSARESKTNLSTSRIPSASTNSLLPSLSMALLPSPRSSSLVGSRNNTPKVSSDEYDSEDDDDEYELEYDHDGKPAARLLKNSRPTPVSRQQSSLALPSYGDLSRNSSQVNITTLVPRTTSSSRIPSFEGRR